MLAKRIPGRLEALAVAAPGCRESDDNILVGVLLGKLARYTKHCQLIGSYQCNIIKRVNVEDLVRRRGRGLDVRLHAGFCGDAENVSVARKEKHSREAHEGVRFCV